MFNTCFVNVFFKTEEHLSDSKMLKRCSKWQKICKQGYDKQIFVHKFRCMFAKKTSRYACYTCEKTCELQVQVKQDIWLMALNGTSFDGHGFGFSSLPRKRNRPTQNHSKKTLRF